MTLIEWIKANAKDGANVSEAEEMISGLDRLGSIKSRDEAATFINDNGFFKSAVDSMVSKAVEVHDQKWTVEKLPGLIEGERTKIRAELNPEETEDQKEVRELREWKAEQVAKQKRGELADTLAAKASEIGFDTEKARRYTAFGENALNEMAKDSEYLATAIKDGVDKAIVEKFGGKAPKIRDDGKVEEAKPEGIEAMESTMTDMGFL